MTAVQPGKVPFYFGTAQRELLGVYHPPAGPSTRAQAVLLCNPIGDDLMRAHRPFRHLAEELAALGFPVLRFDFDGAGDSVGDERDPDRVATWRADIARAAEALRARSGVDRLAFVGLKLGGTLAALAAADLGGVDALVLWGAYLNGPAFVSDVTRAHKMHVMLEPGSFSGGPPSKEGEEALGYLLTPQTIEELKAVDLLALPRSPAKRTLVIDTANVEAKDGLVARLTALGGTATSRHMPGNKFLITSPHQSEIPAAVISAITGWLAEGAPLLDAPAVGRPAAPVAANALGEKPVQFGPDKKLFGILAAPPGGAARPDVPAIIMLNAGTVHRVGSHRLYVPLARHWAKLGFYVLRVDLSGIGDSPVPAGCVENLTYPRDGLDDARAAMDLLTETTGIRKFIVAGLCSGGDIAFQLGFKEPRVASALMINPRTFCVNDLSMVDSYERARWYQQSMKQSDKWKKLLRGDVNITRALLLAAPKVRDLVLQRARRAVTGLLSVVRPNDTAVEQRRETDVPYCLRTMAERGVDTYLFVTEHDPGVDYVDANYGPAMQALLSVPGFRRTDVKGTDHTFTARWAQEQVGAMLTDHLTQRFLSARAA
ncbi:MAG TPA: alpha/beta fold hydrolase [Polyangia bacterium]|nr:alpha/beta fold hydrolase [Polyangia bacterium]